MPSKYRGELAEVAERDARLIIRTIERDRPIAAAKWVRALNRHIRSLKTMPFKFEAIPEMAPMRKDVRHILFGNFRMFYRVEAERVIVLRRVHGARSADDALRDLLSPP